MQHRIAVILFMFAVAFAAMTIFLLCLLQPKVARPVGTGNVSTEKGGIEAIESLAGLPIRRRSLFLLNEDSDQKGGDQITAELPTLPLLCWQRPQEAYGMPEPHLSQTIEEELQEPSEAQTTLTKPHKASPMIFQQTYEATSSLGRGTVHSVSRIAEIDGWLSGRSRGRAQADPGVIDIDAARELARQAGLREGFLIDSIHPRYLAKQS